MLLLMPLDALRLFRHAVTDMSYDTTVRHIAAAMLPYILCHTP